LLCHRQNRSQAFFAIRTSPPILQSASRSPQSLQMSAVHIQLAEQRGQRTAGHHGVCFAVDDHALHGDRSSRAPSPELALNRSSFA
jgi:hypothetical protein